MATACIALPESALHESEARFQLKVTRIQRRSIDAELNSSAGAAMKRPSVEQMGDAPHSNLLWDNPAPHPFEITSGGTE
ncbi:MAG: hypothetical protein ACOY90_18955 [Candidatus Zhuqueibacterota bacterium]